MDNWIFTHNEDNTVRYTLGKLGKRNLICIGINPHKASINEKDNTVTRVSKIANINGYDGWLMLNIYPLRDRLPENLPQEEETQIIKLNQNEISKVLSKGKFNDVWAAWGDDIETRTYFSNCLKGIVSCFGNNYNWIHYGKLTIRDNPRHPSRMSYSEVFHDFDIEQYLK